MDLAVYTAILRRFDAQDLATLSNDTLRVDLKLVQSQVQQLTAAMARVQEMQETVRQLAQGKPVYCTSPSFEELLANTQDMQQRLASSVTKLAAPKTTKPKKEKRKREDEQSKDVVLPSPPIPAMAISPKRDKAEKAEVKTSKGDSKQAIGRLKTNLRSFNSACVALSKGIENSEAEVTTQTVVSQLQTVAELIGSSSYQEVVDRAVQVKCFVRSMDIIVELTLQSDGVHAEHVQMMIDVIDCIATMSENSPPLEKQFNRHKTALVESAVRSNLVSLDTASGRLSADVDAICQDTLAFAVNVLSESTSACKKNITLLADRFQATLQFCQFSSATALEDIPQMRMKIVTQLFDIIVSIVTSLRDPPKQAARFKAVYMDAKAAFESCPTLHDLNKRSEERLEEYIARECESEGKAYDRETTVRGMQDYRLNMKMARERKRLLKTISRAERQE